MIYERYIHMQFIQTNRLINYCPQFVVENSFGRQIGNSKSLTLMFDSCIGMNDLLQHCVCVVINRELMASTIMQSIATTILSRHHSFFISFVLWKTATLSTFQKQSHPIKSILSRMLNTQTHQFIIK